MTDNNAAANNVVANDLTITAPGGITDIETNVDTLTATTTGTDISLNEANGLALSLVDAGVGDVTLTLTAGALTDNNGALNNVVANDLAITAPGGINDLETSVDTLAATAINNNISINEAAGLALNLVDAGTGDVTLALTAGALTDNNAAGNNVVANDLVITAPGGITNIETSVDTLTATTTGTDISSNEAAGLALNLVDAGVGDVTLILAAGALTDNNNGANNVVANDLAITAPGGITSIETSVDTLAAGTTGTDISINEATGVALNLIASGAGNITLAAGGTITDNNGNVAGDNITTTGILTISAVGGIGSANALETTVSTLNATNTGGGAIALTNGAALTITGISNSGAGSNITILNTGAVITTGAVTTTGGFVSLTANSPLTIGVAGISASGAITLVTGDSAAEDDLTINGLVQSTSGGLITLTANDD
ncbi:MAG: hypothetical protein HYU43_07650, partial [Armatimonadetes bacterium]|nr:hypothetical protein [Armatimonadota bacterium]